MKIDFKEMMKYLDYLINDSKIDNEQRCLLIKLYDVIVKSLQVNDIRNKVYCNSKIKDINDRLQTLLKQYIEEKKRLENNLNCNILDYGSQRLSFLEDAIAELNATIINDNTMIEEIIDKHLGYLQNNKQTLLNTCFENLVGNGNFTSFFGTILLRKDQKNSTFIINRSNVEKIYSILNNKVEFAKLEQATRLRDEINRYQEEKEKIDLVIEYYDLIVEDEKLKDTILMLDKKIRFISDKNNYNITQLIEQRNHYCSMPFGDILFKDKINDLSKKIREYQKYHACANKLFDKKLNKEFKKDNIESLLRRKNLYFLFNGEKNDYCSSSKATLVYKQSTLNTQIQKLQKSLQEIISQLSDEYKILYFNDKVTCNNLVFGLKDNQEKFISFYILLMLVLTEKNIDNISMVSEATDQLIRYVIEEYLEIQISKIQNMNTEHGKIFSLRKY